MKVKSEGRLEIVLDEEHIHKVSNGDPWRAEMLKQTTKTATLMEVSCDDHREIRQMLIDNGKTLARIAVSVGIILSILAGVTVVV